MRTIILNNIVDFFNIASENKKLIPSEQDLTEYEKTIIFFVNIINESYHCYEPDEVPYIFYNNQNWIDLKSSFTSISNTTINRLLSYKINDFLWIKCKDILSAKKAFKGFMDIISLESDYDKNYFLFNRCISIYESIKQEDFCFDFKKTLYRIIEQGKNNDSSFSLNILKYSFKKKYLSLSEITPLIEEKLNTYEKLDKDILFIDAYTLLEKILFEKNETKYTEKPCTIEKITTIRRRKADLHIKKSNNTNFQYQISIFK